MIWSSVIFTIEENKTVMKKKPIYVEFIISQITILVVNTNLMQIIL